MILLSLLGIISILTRGCREAPTRAGASDARGTSPFGRASPVPSITGAGIALTDRIPISRPFASTQPRQLPGSVVFHSPWHDCCRRTKVGEYETMDEIVLMSCFARCQ